MGVIDLVLAISKSAYNFLTCGDQSLNDELQPPQGLECSVKLFDISILTKHVFDIEPLKWQ